MIRGLLSGAGVGRARSALRSPSFRFLLTGRLSSQFADGFFQAYVIGQLVFLDPEAQGTALGVAKAYAVLAIPFALVGPIAGVLIDWWPRRTILVVTPAIRMLVAVGLLILSTAEWPLLVLALVVVSSNRFFLSSANASTPSLVSGEDLLVANALATVGGAFASLVGIVIGAKLEGTLGIDALPVMAGVFWAISSVLMTRIRVPLRALRTDGSAREHLRSVAGELWRGGRRLGTSPPALTAVTSIALDQFLLGLIAVLSLVVFREQYRAGLASYGNLVAAGGLGGMVGTLSVGWLESRLSKAAILTLSFVVAGVVALAVAPSLTQTMILLLSAAVGMTFAWRKVAADTIVQQSVPDRFRGRVFAIYDIAYANARVVAGLVAIPLIPRLSTAWIVALVGLVSLLWSPIIPWWVRRRPRITVVFGSSGEPDAVVLAGETEPVRVVEAEPPGTGAGETRQYTLRTTSGDLLEVVQDGRRRWRLARQVVAEVSGERLGVAPSARGVT